MTVEFLSLPMSVGAKVPLRITPRDAFRRRPLFWLALSAGLGVWTAGSPEAPLPLFLAAAVAGFLLAILRRPEVALLLVALGFAGLRAGTALQPPNDPALAAGRMVTLRGTVTGAWGEGPDRGRRAVLNIQSRLEQGGWRRMDGTVGFFAEEPVGVGERLQLSGVLERPLPPTQPGDRSERMDWARRGANVVLDLRALGMRRLAGSEMPPWRSGSKSFRRKLHEWNRQTLSPQAAVIANQFLIGDESPPDSALAGRISQVFRDSGTVHLLVVSGTQVSLVLGVFLWLGIRFHRSRWRWWGVGGAALLFYFLLTDGSAPVQRAAITGGAILAALALERELDPENILGLAALALFALNPLELFDLGFCLSFLAVWGLLRLAPLAYTALGAAPQEADAPRNATCRLWHLAGQLAAASTAAFLATAPLLALEFQRLSWASLLANVVMVPLATLLMYAASLHALLGCAEIPALSGPVDWLANALYRSASVFAGMPGGIQPAFPPPALFMPLFLAIAAALAAFSDTRRKAVAGCVALMGSLAIVCALPAPHSSAPLVRAFDVGQGDATLLESPGGGRLLVDAGTPRGGERLVRALRALRVGSLDAVLATHVDADHIGGIPHLLRSMPVGTLLYHDDDRRDSDWQAVLAAVSERRVPLKRLRAGQRLAIGGAVLSVLGPLEDSYGFATSTNDRSLVARWECGPASVLLTGDSGGDSEAKLLRWGALLQSDVLKVGHHGSAGSTSSPFLDAVRPESALISCGRNNRYGHPSREALARLHSAQAGAYRTDRLGMLTVTWPGSSPRVHAYVRGR